MEEILKLMVQSQQETARALTALTETIQSGGQPRITNTTQRGGGGGRGGGGRSKRQSGRGNQKPRATANIVEVRDVATQREVAERSTQKTRVRTALRQMSLAIFTDDFWWEVQMRRWYNAALRALSGLIALDFPAGSQKEDFLEQIRQVALAFNKGAHADEPKVVMSFVLKTIRDRHGRDAFYDDGHVKIQDSRGRPYQQEDLGKIPLPGISNVKLSSRASEATSNNEDKLGGLGFELLSLLEDGEPEFQTVEESKQSAPASDGKPAQAGGGL